MKIKTIFKKLSKKPMKEREKIINKFSSVILKDIKKICHNICYSPNLKKKIKSKKCFKYKNIVRNIAHSKNLKNIKKLLIQNNKHQKGSGVFTLLGGLAVPAIAKLISDAIG